MPTSDTPARRLPRRPLAPALVLWAMLCGGCDDASHGSASPGGPEERAEVVRTADGTSLDAVLAAPAPEARNGWGVLMIGGGMGNDLHWTVPGSVETDGQSIQMTISGMTHADAPPISDALVEQGFVVMRWSTIAQDDPLADQWPVRATPRSLSELTEQTRAALQTLRASALVAPDRIILLGHSLGAARACTVAAEDEGIRGLILLCPAYLTRSESAPRSLESEGLRFGSESLRDRPIPCLALFGALDDSRAVDSGAAAGLSRGGGLAGFEARILPGLGHQLGPTDAGRHGPIDADVVAQIAEWARSLAAG